MNRHGFTCSVLKRSSKQQVVENEPQENLASKILDDAGLFGEPLPLAVNHIWIIERAVGLE